MIQLFQHKDTGRVTTSQTGGALARITQKRFTTLVREILFHDGEDLVTLDPDAEGMFVAKAKSAESGLPEGGLRVWDVAWDAPTEQGAGYVFRVPIWGEELEGLTADESGNIVLAAEIHVVNDGELLKSQTFDLIVAPPVYTEDDPPDDPEDPFPPTPDILVKTAQVLTSGEQSQVRQNLGLAGMLGRVAVAGPVDFETVGQDGQYWFDEATSRLWVYLGGQFRYTTMISGS